MSEIAMGALGYGMMAVSTALFGWIFYRRSVSVGRTGWAWLLHATWVFVAFGLVYGALLQIVYGLFPIVSVEIGPSGDPMVHGPGPAVQLLLGLVSSVVAVGAAYVLAPRVLRPSPDPAYSIDRPGEGFVHPLSPDAGFSVEVPIGGTRLGPLSGLFVFNYNDMDSNYGHQAFASIQAALSDARGKCIFCDGDVSTTGVAGLVKSATRVVPVGSDSPLADPDGTPSGFGPYLAAMWTDVPSNFRKVHDVLCEHEVAGYVGHMTLAGAHAPLDFVQTMGRQLMLPAGYVFIDGTVAPGTNKYRT